MALIHIQIPEDLKNKLKAQARKKGITLNAYVRMLLLDIVELEESK